MASLPCTDSGVWLPLRSALTVSFRGKRCRRVHAKIERFVQDLELLEHLEQAFSEPAVCAKIIQGYHELHEAKISQQMQSSWRLAADDPLRIIQIMDEFLFSRTVQVDALYTLSMAAEFHHQDTLTKHKMAEQVLQMMANHSGDLEIIMPSLSLLADLMIVHRENTLRGISLILHQAWNDDFRTVPFHTCTLILKQIDFILDDMADRRTQISALTHQFTNLLSDVQSLIERSETMIGPDNALALFGRLLYTALERFDIARNPSTSISILKDVTTKLRTEIATFQIFFLPTIIRQVMHCQHATAIVEAAACNVENRQLLGFHINAFMEHSHTVLNDPDLD